ALPIYHHEVRLLPSVGRRAEEPSRRRVGRQHIVSSIGVDVPDGEFQFAARLGEHDPVVTLPITLDHDEPAVRVREDEAVPDSVAIEITHLEAVHEREQRVLESLQNPCHERRTRSALHCVRDRLALPRHATKLPTGATTIEFAAVLAALPVVVHAQWATVAFQVVAPRGTTFDLRGLDAAIIRAFEYTIAIAANVAVHAI